MNELQRIVEASVEELLRTADTKIQWKNSSSNDNNNKEEEGYFELPGYYTWCGKVPSPKEETSDTEEEIPSEETLDPTSTSEETSTSTSTSEETSTLEETSNKEASTTFSLVLHGDNTFDYKWYQEKHQKSTHLVEIKGTWSSPELNRDCYGTYNDLINVVCEKIRFTRQSNYDTESQKFKVTLHTFVRNGEDWVPMSNNDDTNNPLTLPPCSLQFKVNSHDKTLCRVITTTTTSVQDILIPTKASSRILAGLTKKAMIRLGDPIDIMTSLWLIPSDIITLTKSTDNDNDSIRPFNPLKCLAAILKKNKGLNKSS